MKRLLRRLVRNTGAYRRFAAMRTRTRFHAITAEDQPMVDFYRQFIAPGDLVFDVGANMGNRTRIFLALGAQVVAFEPQLACARQLSSVLAGHHGFTLVESALGASAGVAEMLVSDTLVLSTLSRDWIERTKGSGRFSQHDWSRSQQVSVSTLDLAVGIHGVPAFIKIDVEGFEYEVLAGLSSPVRGVSIEFAADNYDVTCKCIDRMASMAPSRFQFSLGESMSFYLPEWQDADGIKATLKCVRPSDPMVWGDVYIRQGGSP